MPRLQFTIRALLMATLAVAVACAIWVKLPVAVKVAIIGAPLGVLMWLWDWGAIDAIDALLAARWPQKPENGPRYVIKWRRRGEKKRRA